MSHGQIWPRAHHVWPGHRPLRGLRSRSDLSGGPDRCPSRARSAARGNARVCVGATIPIRAQTRAAVWSGGATIATATTRRFEARLDDETDDLIGQAAELTRQSTSAFITAAARAEADRDVAWASITLVTPAVLDALATLLADPYNAPDLVAKLTDLPLLPTKRRSVPTP